MAKVATAILLAMLFTVAVNLRVAAQTPGESPIIHVSIITDGPSERAAALRAVIVEEMRAVNRGEFDVQMPTQFQIDADWTLKGVQNALDRALADQRIDLVVTLGVLASHAAAHHARLPKPVVAPFVADRKLQRFPFKDDASGKENLSYISLDVDIQRDLAVFREIVPFTRLAFLLDGAMEEAIPDIRQEFARIARAFRTTVDLVQVHSSAAKTLAQIHPATQAVYVGPLFRLSAPEFEQLAAGLIERRLPSFAFSGKSDVERGLLASITPALRTERLARRVALNVRRILLGEKAAALPVEFARQEALTLNMRTAHAIGYSPSWSLLTRAELLFDTAEERGGRPLSFADAVREAVEANLDVRTARANVSAGEENIRVARSALLPQIGLNGRHVAIDADDAAALPGRAERTTSGSVTLDLPLYSEAAWANYGVQKLLQAARESDHDQVRLDIVLATAQAYLGVLGAKTNERIQKDNLRLTRSNLDLARARHRIGTAGPSEVYRWESEIANAQRTVVEAQAQTRIAEMALNELLHRPLEEALAPIEVGLDDPVLITSQQRLYDLIDNPARFRVFRDFVVQEGIAAAPELRQFDARILAQERTLESTRRAFWQPTVNLRAARNETLARSGARGPTLAGIDDHETSIALQLSIPLFTSGGLTAQQNKAHKELTGLRVQRQAAAERIERRVRAALHTARSALTAIRLSRQETEAAQNNLNVVRDAYSRGTVSVLDLLDAQNAALVGDLRAATGVYDFVRSLVEVERAAARFDFFLTATDQADWLARVERYFLARGVSVPQHEP